MKYISLILLLFLTNLFSKDLEKITLQLQWKHQFQFAGYYIAKEKGFYKDVGLEVEIKEFDHGINPVDEVVSNKATYATGRSSLIIDRSKGKPIHALAAIFQSSPLVLMVSPKSNIKTIKDLKGKTIMLSPDESTTVSINAMLTSQKISLKDMIQLKHSFNVNDLINGAIDVSSAYISVQPHSFLEKGLKPVIFDPKDYGFDFYNDILFTSTNETSNYPQRVKNFKEASLKGWEYAFKNINESVELILEKYNTQNKTKRELIFEAEASKELAYYKVKKIGQIDRYKFENIYDIYNVMGYIEKQIDFNQFIFQDKEDSLYLKQKEIHYLEEKQSITLCIDPSWMPFEAVDKNGKHIGISADYFELFSKMLDTQFNVIKTESWSESLEFAKQRKCDILPLAMQTPQRKVYMDFTTPYLKIPLVIATKTNIPFIDNLQSIEGKKIGIPKGYAFVEILREKYPELTIIEVENINDGLKKVKQGKLFGYIGTLAGVGYSFQTKFNGELKIAGKFDEYWELGIGVRNDDLTLLNIMQKAVDKLDSKQQQKILNNWIAIKYENGIDYSLAWKVLAGAIIVIIIFFIYIRKLHKLKNELDRSHKSLEKFIDTQDNIVILTDNKELSFANKSFYDYFGYKNLEHFREGFQCICEKFVENDAYFHLGKLQSGQNWLQYLEKLPHSQRVVGMLRFDFSIQAFAVTINKFDENLYIVSFTNITQTLLCHIELQDKSVRDTLTNAYNREYFDNNYQKLITDSHNARALLGLAFLDIDHFKSVNDTYGHDVGDEILIEFVKTVKEFSRDTDVLIRWGGEEFILLLKVKTKEGLQKALEHIRKVIEQTHFSTISSITCSIGGTIYQDDEDIKNTIKRADIGVYEAKKNGRNKVVIK